MISFPRWLAHRFLKVLSHLLWPLGLPRPALWAKAPLPRLLPPFVLLLILLSNPPLIFLLGFLPPPLILLASLTLYLIILGLPLPWTQLRLVYHLLAPLLILLPLGSSFLDGQSLHPPIISLTSWPLSLVVNHQALGRPLSLLPCLSRPPPEQLPASLPASSASLGMP
jgi:hypothetical protein